MLPPATSDADALNEIAELGGAEIEQSQSGIDGEMVVEQPHATALGEGPGDCELSGTRRPVDDDVLTSSASLDHVTVVARPDDRRYLFRPAFDDVTERGGFHAVGVPGVAPHHTGAVEGTGGVARASRQD